MRLDYQILLKSLPLALLAGSASVLHLLSNVFTPTRKALEIKHASQ